MGEVSALIKTFLRDEYLYKCVDSLHKTYPDVKIIIGDGGYYSKKKKEFVEQRNGKYIHLPFDCGLPYGRHRLLEQAETPYILIGDDDFYYTGDVELEKMVTLLGTADIVGGRVRQDGNIGNYQGFIEHTKNQLLYRKLLLDDWKHYKGLRYKLCDVTYNFFVAPTEVVKDVRWDENIKVAYEHSDFFLTAKEKGYKTAFTPHCIVDHKPKVEIPEADQEKYMKFRNRREDKEYFFKKRNLESAVDMNGFMDKL